MLGPNSTMKECVQQICDYQNYDYNYQNAAFCNQNKSDENIFTNYDLKCIKDEIDLIKNINWTTKRYADNNDGTLKKYLGIGSNETYYTNDDIQTSSVPNIDRYIEYFDEGTVTNKLQFLY